MFSLKVEAAFTFERLTAKPIHILSPQSLEMLPLSPFTQQWLNSSGFEAKAGQHALLPNEQGGLEGALYVMDKADPFRFGKLARALPKGQYVIEDPTGLLNSDLAYLSYGLEAYRFDLYKKSEPVSAQLFLPESHRSVLEFLKAIYSVRDFINTPAEDLGPAHLAQAAKALAEEFGAAFKEVVGDELLAQNFPAIYAVGKGAGKHREPRLIHFEYGNPSHRTVCLVGKGVCFDTGGLDIKNSTGMALMKKDMGGAAHVLGLARLIMAFQLPIHLHVMIPAVENSISGDSYRPGDVVKTRQGYSVEIDNTDAEGRVVLADALALASEQKPALIVDFATLTGAARVALGPELAALFTPQDEIAEELSRLGKVHHDLVWRLPLHEPYRDYFKSDIADFANSGGSGFAGATTAALFLQSFVSAECDWMHFDIAAWNSSAKPGRPKGGEAQALRCVFEYLKAWAQT